MDYAAVLSVGMIAGWMFRSRHAKPLPVRGKKKTAQRSYSYYYGDKSRYYD